jgi:hypothetical protein
MAKIFRIRKLTTSGLERRKIILLQRLRVPPNVVRASHIEQFLTCGKSTCRCRRGFKHGPFHYLVQCLRSGKVRKFLLKTSDSQQEARGGVAAYVAFQEQLEELSQINTELLYRGELLKTSVD